ncbi:MAG: hypothetical protein GKS05_00435 [Nitrospirales bacterium]|nr:hypothetical protein [Nitrospirales bacterium]
MDHRNSTGLIAQTFQSPVFEEQAMGPSRASSIQQIGDNQLTHLSGAD